MRSTENLLGQLKKYKFNAADLSKETSLFCQESPYARSKREVQKQLAQSEKYRASILRTVATFGIFLNKNKFGHSCFL
jgi:hypothetical protein